MGRQEGEKRGVERGERRVKAPNTHQLAEIPPT